MSSASNQESDLIFRQTAAPLCPRKSRMYPQYPHYPQQYFVTPPVNGYGPPPQALPPQPQFQPQPQPPATSSLLDQLRQRGLDPSGFASDSDAIDALLKAAEIAASQSAELQQLRQQASQPVFAPQIETPATQQAPQQAPQSVDLNPWRRYLELDEQGHVRPKAEAAGIVPFAIVQEAEAERQRHRQHLEDLRNDPREAIRKYGADFVKEEVARAIKEDRERRERDSSIEKFIDENKSWIYSEDGALTPSGTLLMEQARELQFKGVPEHLIFPLAVQSTTAELANREYAYRQAEKQQAAQPQYNYPPQPQQPQPQYNYPPQQFNGTPQFNGMPRFEFPNQQAPAAPAPQYAQPQYAQPQYATNQPQPTQAPPQESGNFFQRNAIPPGALQSQSRNVPEQSLGDDETFDVDRFVEATARELGHLPPESSEIN